ncbi:dimethyladenosine transferase 2, mitochondrial isoform X2 [Tribolium madens]|uniref:dimethyladenosine transferase 2, mitochondrial isoform X2 n=1 Tax=Tribolium madens TaxID=41895 RepID=UPI001CF7672F|nr:dimethyladenosine transferase 2, mitochondrial isoform X2 [Tribolium madens]
MNINLQVLKQRHKLKLLPPICKCLNKFESTKCEDILFTSEEIAPPPIKSSKVIPEESRKSHRARLGQFFRKHPHLYAVKDDIPEKYLALKRLTPPDNLYLIDVEVAKKAVTHILPDIRTNENQLVCETNAGLGLISGELLDNGVKLVRLYESCPDFKHYLKSRFEPYKGRVELFTKDLFLLHRYEFIDKQDHGNRVEQLLKGIPTKAWDDGPVLTIIGTMANMNFIRFLMKSVVLQSFITTLGRIQLYVFMKPRDYVLTAGPHLNLHTYKRWSVFFNLFFDYELFDKFPRQVFLPWQSKNSAQLGRYPGQVDPDMMYFVRINFKQKLPVATKNLLPFYAFIMQFFGQGRQKIIPTLERWVPGAGLDVMIPKSNHSQYFKDINIFTKFGELTPEQILAVFEEMISHPEYKQSHFVEAIESQLIKTETIETSLEDHFEKRIEH